MRRKSKGFIFIAVLFSLTLLLTAATAFAWFARTESKREAARENILKCRGAAEAAADIVGEMIATDRSGHDGFDEALYAPGGGIRLKIGEYDVKVHITPLCGKMPVNALLLPDRVTVREEYRYAWNSIWEEMEHDDLALRVIDFIDADSKQTLGGAEDEKNINRPLADLSELKAVSGIDDGLLWGGREHPGGIARYLDTLDGQKININIAEAEMIAKLDPAITLDTARLVTASRLSSPLKSIEDLRRIPGFPAALATKLANVIGYESIFFLLETNVSAGGGTAARNYRITVRRLENKCIIEKWEE
ncbi:MAG: general secretion pathway protein GspK [Synergistes sp.]|nr:general secretion pathway protein GspK [Synergistes sp.]